MLEKLSRYSVAMADGECSGDANKKQPRAPRIVLSKPRIRLVALEDAKKRRNTYKKRSQGLMKKAKELSTMCGVDAAVFSLRCDELDGFEWSNVDGGVVELLQRYLALPQEQVNKKKLDVVEELQVLIGRASRELSNMTKNNRDMQKRLMERELESTKDFLNALRSREQAVLERISSLTEEPMEELAPYEKYATPMDEEPQVGASLREHGAFPTQDRVINLGPPIQGSMNGQGVPVGQGSYPPIYIAQPGCNGNSNQRAWGTSNPSIITQPGGQRNYGLTGWGLQNGHQSMANNYMNGSMCHADSQGRHSINNTTYRLYHPQPPQGYQGNFHNEQYSNHMNGISYGSYPGHGIVQNGHPSNNMETQGHISSWPQNSRFGAVVLGQMYDPFGVVNPQYVEKFVIPNPKSFEEGSNIGPYGEANGFHNSLVHDGTNENFRHVVPSGEANGFHNSLVHDGTNETFRHVVPSGEANGFHNSLVPDGTYGNFHHIVPSEVTNGFHDNLVPDGTNGNCHHGDQQFHQGQFVPEGMEHMSFSKRSNEQPSNPQQVEQSWYWDQTWQQDQQQMQRNSSFLPELQQNLRYSLS